MTTAIPFRREMTPRYDEPERLSARVRRVLAKNANRFTYLGSGTYIVGEGDVAVVDPGPDDPTHIDAILRALNPGEHVSHIFVTHHHLDHMGGVGELQARTGASSYGYGWDAPSPESDLESFHFGDPEAEVENSTAGDEEVGRDFVSFRPDVVLTHGDVVTVGDHVLEAVHTPGHASDHLCYAFAQEELLLTGDHVMGWSTSVIPPPDGDLNAYMASLELLLRRSDASYLPTHGPQINQPRTFVEALLTHRRERNQQILDTLSDGPKTVLEIVPRIYSDVSKQLWSAAAASVWAHVLALAATGEISQTEGPLTRTSRVYLCGQ